MRIILYRLYYSSSDSSLAVMTRCPICYALPSIASRTWPCCLTPHHESRPHSSRKQGRSASLTHSFLNHTPYITCHHRSSIEAALCSGTSTHAETSFLCPKYWGLTLPARIYAYKFNFSGRTSINHGQWAKEEADSYTNKSSGVDIKFALGGGFDSLSGRFFFININYFI